MGVRTVLCEVCGFNEAKHTALFNEATRIDERIRLLADK